MYYTLVDIYRIIDCLLYRPYRLPCFCKILTSVWVDSMERRKPYIYDIDSTPDLTDMMGIHELGLQEYALVLKCTSWLLSIFCDWDLVHSSLMLLFSLGRWFSFFFTLLLSGGPQDMFPCLLWLYRGIGIIYLSLTVIW